MTWSHPLCFFKNWQPVNYFSLLGFFFGSVKNKPEIELLPEGEKMVNETHMLCFHLIQQPLIQKPGENESRCE